MLREPRATRLPFRSDPVTPDASRNLTRRGLLLGLVGVAGAGALAGCGLFGEESPDGTLAPSPLAGFYTETVALAERYEAVLAAVPALASLITSVRDNHVAHRDALAKAVIPLPTASPSADAGPAPRDRNAALAELVAAEAAARDSAVNACLAAPDHLASLVGAIAAARATHLIVLS